MEAKKIVVVGSSGHARVVMDVIEKQGLYQIAGLIDSFKPAGEAESGYEILGTESDLPGLVKNLGLSGCFVAIGDNWQRHLVVNRIKDLIPALEFITAIHPSAQIGRGVEVGRGTVIMAGAIVNSGSKVGEFCIINTKASLDHDCAMEEFSSFAPGSTTGGNVRIGAFSAVSLGVNIIHGRSIGMHTVIGAGALVLDDIPGNSVAYGMPASVIKKRQAGDKYL